MSLPIIGRSEDGAWYQVEYQGRPAWVRRSTFVRVEGDLDRVPVVSTEAAAPAAEQPTLVITGMGAYLRDAPSPDAKFTSISNMSLPIIGRSEDGAWYQVEYEGRPGWIRQSAFVRVEGDPDSVPIVGAEAAAPAAGQPMLEITGMGAYLRDAPTFDAPFTPISSMTLPIIGRSEDGAWYQVEYEGRPGWIRQSAFVRIEGDLDRVPVIR
jgi:SH3-like domain-containing protein